jgi:ribosomal protein L32
MNQQDATRIKELGLDALKNSNPNLRKVALLELRKYNAPIVADVFERIIEKDHNKEVRDLAHNLLTQHRIQAAQRPPEPKSKANDPNAWKCAFCGSEVTAHDRCPNCGAERNDKIAFDMETDARSALDANEFLMKPEHESFVLGRSKTLSRGTPFRMVFPGCFMMMFVLCGLTFLSLVINDTYQALLIAMQGVPTEARYTNRRISSGDDSDTYYLTYEYTVRERRFSHQQSVSSALYENAEIGGRTQILYAPSNPSIAKIVGTNQVQWFLVGFVLLWNGIVWLIVIGLVSQYRLEKLLERKGRLLKGKILDVSHSTDSDGDLTLHVKYEFQSPESGKLLAKHERAQRNDLKHNQMPLLGTPIHVLYYNDRNFMLL